MRGPLITIAVASTAGLILALAAHFSVQYSATPLESTDSLKSLNARAPAADSAVLRQTKRSTDDDEDGEGLVAWQIELGPDDTPTKRELLSSEVTAVAVQVDLLLKPSPAEPAVVVALASRTIEEVRHDFPARAVYVRLFSDRGAYVSLLADDARLSSVIRSGYIASAQWDANATQLTWRQQLGPFAQWAGLTTQLDAE